MTSDRLRAAFRRNAHRRGFPEFLTAITETTGMSKDDISLVDAEESLRFEDLLMATIESGLASNVVRRRTELAWLEAEDVLQRFAMNVGEADVFVYLCHSPEYIFRTRIRNFQKHAKRIVQFDGDTIYAATCSLREGFGVDMYTSEVTDEIEFTVDWWGYDITPLIV